MKPNINRRGRFARAICGAVCILLAIALLLIGWPTEGLYRWLAGGVLFAAGAFQLFEAKKGWCVARACGIRTPM